MKEIEADRSWLTGCVSEAEFHSFLELKKVKPNPTIEEIMAYTKCEYGESAAKMIKWEENYLWYYPLTNA